MHIFDLLNIYSMSTKGNNSKNEYQFISVTRVFYFIAIKQDDSKPFPKLFSDKLFKEFYKQFCPPLICFTATADKVSWYDTLPQYAYFCQKSLELFGVTLPVTERYSDLLIINFMNVSSVIILVWFLCNNEKWR